uniref:Syntaxin N-terminal domain-containing protein n=1 Tax=Rhodosorus marinus TaxID=101924 RepID=A0A7S2ZKV9_9RHOD|mmetsp:Transcript_21958/g.89233  ORF Transcript_21958/g.89233 Transcript_21958/m.89233 type:complete len:179 (+) Transcript_21958:90-626(+)
MSFANSNERDDPSTGGSAVSVLSVLVSTIHANNQVLKRLVKLPSDKPRQRSLDELVSRNTAAQAEGEGLGQRLEREKPQSVRDEVAANKLVRDFRSVVREFQDVRKILESQEKVQDVSPYGARKIATKPEADEKTYLLGGDDQLSQSQLLLLEVSSDWEHIQWKLTRSRIFSEHCLPS